MGEAVVHGAVTVTWDVVTWVVVIGGIVAVAVVVIVLILVVVIGLPQTRQRAC